MALVGFIDLLGFSAAIENNWNLESDVVKYVLEIKREFRKYVENPVKVRMVGDNPEVSVCPDLFSLSDSFVIVKRVAGLDDLGIMMSFWNVAVAIHFINRFATRHGFAIRGGLELGEVHWDGAELIGPAFNSAYRIESKVCKSARVLIGPNLIEFFIKNSLARNYPEAKGAFYKCNDGIIMLTAREEAIISSMADISEKVKANDNIYSKYHDFLSHVNSRKDYIPSNVALYKAKRLIEKMLNIK